MSGGSSFMLWKDFRGKFDFIGFLYIWEEAGILLEKILGRKLIEFYFIRDNNYNKSYTSRKTT